MLRRFIFLAFLLCTIGGWAQELQTPLNRSHAHLWEAWTLKNSENVRMSAFKPFMVSAQTLDSLRDGASETWTRRSYSSKLMRKLKNDHLIEIREEDFYVNGDFILDLAIGQDLNDQSGKRIYHNTRGLQFEGAIGRRVFFSTAFYENQSVFPDYMDDVITSRNSVPGYGRYKVYENFEGDTAYDYAFATGAAGVKLSKYSFIQLGYDRQFVGHGFRSMLLSDVSSPYPFIRGNLGLLDGKVQYSLTWAMMQGGERVPLGNNRGKEFPFERNRAKFSYLSFLPNRWLEVGLFTAFLQPYWTDTANIEANWDYYAPSGLLSVALSEDAVTRVVGVNVGVRPFDFLRLYGQFVNQRYTGNGFQLGLHLIDPLKWNHLSLRAEFNKGELNHSVARDFGSGSTLPRELSYTHNAQFIGHPLDGPFEELLVQGSFRVRDFEIRGTLMRYTIDPLVTTEFASARTYVNAEVSYIVNPMSLAQFVVGATYRSDQLLPSTQLIYVGFRTSLLNRYSEF